MCGFVSMLSNDRLPEFYRKIIVDMSRIISHRGPDNTNYYFSDHLIGGFNRLSIIDLHERANQPFVDENYIIFYNGELYNFIEIRKELEEKGIVFTTHSDTEVVFESLKKWEEKALLKFRGMFSIVFYNKKQKTAILTRDHLGIKPLYFTHIKNILVASSEMKAFMPLKKLSPNYNKLIEYLSFGMISSYETLFDDIYQVMPGEYIKFYLKEEQVKKECYFKIKETFSCKRISCNFNKLDNLLEKSIYMHTYSDVDYGVQLSGGLDSSFITAILAKTKHDLKTFSIGFENKNIDETYYQNKVSNIFKTIHSHYLFDMKEYSEMLLEAIYFFEYPLHHPNIIPSLVMNKIAKNNGLKVLLSGEGADEIFRGYKWHDQSIQYKIDKDILRSSQYVDPYFCEMVFKNFSFNINDRLEEISFFEKNDDKLIFLDQNFFLQKWLHRQDRMGMASSIEIRVPFCNVDILTYVNSVKNNEKILDGETKFLLKKISENYLPKDIIYRDKVGFTVPQEDSFRNEKQLGKMIKFIKDDRFKKRGIYNTKYVDTIINEHLSGVNSHGMMLWLLLNVELWHRIFFDSEK